MCPPTSLLAGRTSLLVLIKPRTVASSLPWNRAMRNAPCLRLCTVLVSASPLLCMVSASALAQQQTAGSGISGRPLPDAPLPKSGPLGSAQPVLSAEGSASVAGLVLDASGPEFMNILPGSYRVIVDAGGFAPFASARSSSRKSRRMRFLASYYPRLRQALR